MNTSQLVYFIMSLTTLGALVVVALIIAGKDIFFALRRKFFSKGCDVFMANSNRQLNRMYLFPKDGTFKIKGKTYITNPDKVMSLGDQMKNDVNMSLKSKHERIEKQIKRFEEKIAELANMASEANNESLAKKYASAIIELNNKINLLREKLKDNEEVYYFERRPAFLYIEGDPVPKNLFEWMTEMDCIALDNIVTRSLSQDPKQAKSIDKMWQAIKILLLVAAIGAAIAAFFAFKNHSFIQQIAQQQGITLRV